jgi:hypothetical protein
MGRRTCAVPTTLAATTEELWSRFRFAHPTRLSVPYCTLSATNRNSPSPFETSSRADFLPSFLS